MEQNQILRRDKVLEVTGMGQSWLYKAVAEGEFPKPVRLTRRSVGWRAGDVAAWLDSRETA